MGLISAREGNAWLTNHDPDTAGGAVLHPAFLVARRTSRILCSKHILSIVGFTSWKSSEDHARQCADSRYLHPTLRRLPDKGDDSPY
jgi:hypothetical protein